MTFPLRPGAVRLGAAALALGLAASAPAAVFVVDDDNVPCSGASHHRIGDALALAHDGDQIRVCLGTYPEQLVVTRQVSILGAREGDQRPVLAPVALPVLRPGLEGGNPVAAALVVDAPRTKIENLAIDLGGVDVSACTPLVAGLHLRNASGALRNVTVANARVPSRPDCPSGVGVLIESGLAGEVFGRPVWGRVAASVLNLRVDGFQRAGVVATGPGTLVKIRGAGLTGDPAVPGGPPRNGVEFTGGAGGRLLDARIEGVHAAVPGRTAAGILVRDGGRIHVRKSTVVDVETGAFLVGDKHRLLSSQIADASADAVVVFGNDARLFSNAIDHASVSGVFLAGDDVRVAGGNISHTPIGVWYFDGSRDVAEGILYVDVLLPEQVGGVRSLTRESAVPLRLACDAPLACDDGNPCTADACDLLTGRCGHVPLPDGASCGGGTCQSGACS